MTAYRLHISPIALDDIADAKDWYNTQNPVTAYQFLQKVDEGFDRILSNPNGLPFFDPPIRKCVLRQFPFILYYYVADSDITIISCFHTKRDSNMIHARME